jgi:hypothetical protein
MLHTISWMVTREPEEARDRVRARILTWFLIGGVAGGALMGAMIAVAAGELFTVIGSRTTIFVAIAAVVASAYAGRAANLWHLPKPQLPHQVPEAWRNIFGLRFASFIYAGGLGMIYFTRLGSLAAYPLALLLLGMGRIPLAIIEMMAAVGLVRASAALVLPVRGLDRMSGDAVPTWLQKHSKAMQRGEVLVLVGLILLPIGMLLTRYFI